MVFLSVYIILSGISHYLVYRFVLRWLALGHPATRWGLFGLMTLLAFSFMAAFFLLRWTQAPWAVAVYRCAAVWQALAINLMMAATAGWIVYGVLRLCGLPPAVFAPAATIVIVLALAGSAIGFWRAFHPVVTEVEVKLPALPERWHGRTIVQLSDVHLGHFHDTQALRRLGERVRALAPDMIVITGDLFDGMTDGMREFAEPLRALSAPRGVFFVTGNHEVYAGLRRCIAMVEDAGIRVLANEVVDADGLNLMGIAYPGVPEPGDIRGLSEARSNGRPLVLLFHTPADIRLNGGAERRTATYWQPDTSFALARELGVSLQLSGHTHAGQMFPFGWLTRRIYNGYDYGLHREGRFMLYTSSGIGTWGPPMRTQQAPEIVRITLNPLESLGFETR